MFPFLLSGDRLLVQRCTAVDLSPGDIAVLVDNDHRLIAHVVQQTEPLRTSTFRGVADENPMNAIGRVIALKRFGLRVPLEPRVTWAAHRLASQRSIHFAAHFAFDTALITSRPLRRAWVNQLKFFRPKSAESSQVISWVARVDGARSALALEKEQDRVQIGVLKFRQTPVAVGWRSTSGAFTCVVSRWAADLNLADRLQRELS